MWMMKKNLWRSIVLLGCLFGLAGVSPSASAQTDATPATPTFSPGAATFPTAPVTVTISDATEGATIYYTTDNTTPTTNSIQYSKPFTIETTQTIQAIAVDSDGIQSEVASTTYIVPPDFAITLGLSSLTVKSGGSASMGITMQGLPEGGNVNFSCSNLPKDAICDFKVEPVPTPFGVEYITLTVSSSTTSATHYSYGSGLVLATVLCFFGWKRRRPMQILLLAVCIGALGTLTACGGDTPIATPTPTPTPIHFPPTPIPTTTVTVTATSGSISHTADFELTVY